MSEFALGAMMFGAFGNEDHDESVRMIRTAIDGGVNFIDTADFYSNGESEEIVGKAVSGDRGGSPRYIKRAVENSLRRLGTDYIDVYQMHRPDPRTDIDETLGALSELVRAGKVRVIGSSS